MNNAAAACRVIGFILSVLMLCAGLSYSRGKPTLAVMDLNGAGISASDAAALTDALYSGLVSTRSFAVLGRGQRDQVLREWGFSPSGPCGDTACLFEAGRYLHVNKMVGGTIDKSGQGWRVAVLMLDLKTGGIDMAVARELDGDQDAVLSYLREISKDMHRVGAGAADHLAGGTADRRNAKIEFSLSGGVRLARDRFTANQTIAAPGSVVERYVLSENRGGYCLEAGVACAGLWRFAPVCFVDYFCDRAAISSAPAEQYLRSRGGTVIAGLSYPLDLSFVTLTAVAGAGYEWETVEQQNEYFGGMGFANSAPAAAAGLRLDSPLFMGIWTSLGYKYVYTRCSPAGWSDQDIRYTFTPRRERHLITFGLTYKP